MATVTEATNHRYNVPVDRLLDQFAQCMRYRIHQNTIDMGEYPETTSINVPGLPKLKEKTFKFIKWVYRANGSDLALVSQPKGKPALLKMILTGIPNFEDPLVDD
jgi:hypothetical protein